MNKKDWILMAIASSRSQPLQPVHLQKALFLFGERLSNKQLKVKKYYNFEPYDYGPFCKEVYRDAETLNEEGLIEIRQPDFVSYNLYSLTEAGESVARRLREGVDSEVKEYLDKIISWVTSLTFKQLINWIYRKFPKMKKNSVFQS